MTNVEKWRKSKTKKKQFFSMKRFFVACDREHSKKMFVKGTKIDSPLMSIPHISVSRLVCLRTLFAILVGRQTLNLSLPSRQHSNSVRTFTFSKRSSDVLRTIIIYSVSENSEITRVCQYLHP